MMDEDELKQMDINELEELHEQLQTKINDKIGEMQEA